MNMADRGPYRIPPTSALIAFDSAARHGNFSRAAKELRTSQSAISRHIAGLEQQLSTRLFERSRTGVSLTDAGNRYRDAVAVGLGAIHAGAAEVAELSQDEQTEVVIACSDEVSHLFVMPRYDGLQTTLGEQVRIRVLTYHYRAEYLPPEPVPDLILTWNAADTEPADRTTIYREAVWPVCSPGYAETHAETLSGPVTGWGALTFLDLSRPNEGWMSWNDWFEIVGQPTSQPRLVGYDGYLYVMEAAALGHGIAMGWRHFTERYLDSRSLIPLTDAVQETDNYYYGTLTEKGRRRPIARQCLTFLGHSV